MGKTSIETFDFTWPTVWGCPRNCKTPKGTPYCFARGINKMYPRIPDFDIPTFYPKKLDWPFPNSVKTIFVNSMSDVCYWKPEWLEQTIEVIKKYLDKWFIFYTKDHEFYNKNFELFNQPNIVLGYTATINSEYRSAQLCANRFGYTGEHNIDLENMEVGIRYGFKKVVAKLLLNMEPMFDIPEPHNFHGCLWDWVIIGAITKYEKPSRDLFLMADVVKCYTLGRIPLYMKGSMEKHILGGLIQEYPIFLQKEVVDIKPEVKESDQIECI